VQVRHAATAAAAAKVLAQLDRRVVLAKALDKLLGVGALGNAEYEVILIIAAEGVRPRAQ
jgi:hypothetical protein